MRHGCGVDVVTRAGAVASGLTGAEVDRRLRDGSWLALRRGVYAPRSADRTAAEAMAAVRALGGEAVVSHETAARLQGIPLLDEPAGISVTRTTGSTRRLSRLRVHVAALPKSHVHTVGPLRVTAPARTVVDLARRLPHAAALVAADGALHLGAVRPDDLAEVLVRCATWPGVRRAARVVRLADGRAESPLETLCRDLLARHGVPAPVLQGIVADRRTGWFARVDFLWPESSTVVEADGRVKYGEPADLWREKLRQERIEELGYLVRRVTWGQVTRQPEATVARIRRALERPR
jgi:hypothetical protein